MEARTAEGAVNIWWTALGNGDRFWKGATAGFRPAVAYSAAVEGGHAHDVYVHVVSDQEQR